MFHRLDRVISLSAVIPLIFSLPYPLCIFSFVGTSGATHVTEEDANAGIIGEIAVTNPLLRPTTEMGLSVESGTISSEVVDFFRKFDERTPNPHLEWHFRRFNGPLVSFGGFWVPSDSVPYLQQLITKHGNFVAKFKLGAGLGGPMLSFLSSMLAAMGKFDLGSVTKVQIFAWKSVVQDLMEVGFDVGFMIGHLRQIAPHLFGKKISDEM
jgi:hypothetical protein